MVLAVVIAFLVYRWKKSKSKPEPNPANVNVNQGLHLDLPPAPVPVGPDGYVVAELHVNHDYLELDAIPKTGPVYEEINDGTRNDDQQQDEDAYLEPNTCNA